MAGTPDTRKPVDQLRVDDFDSFPIWEYASDEETQPGCDETWVRPVASPHVPRDSNSQIVAASFELPSGRSVLGLLVVSTADDLEIGQPVFIEGDAYLPVPPPRSGIPEFDRVLRGERQRLTLTLNIEEADLEGVRYTLRARIEGEKELRSEPSTGRRTSSLRAETFIPT